MSDRILGTNSARTLKSMKREIRMDNPATTYGASPSSEQISAMLLQKLKAETGKKWGERIGLAALHVKMARFGAALQFLMTTIRLDYL